MTASLQARLLAAFIASLGCAPAMAATALSTVGIAESRLLDLPTTLALSANTDFLSQAVDSSLPQLGGDSLVGTASASLLAGPRAYALALDQGSSAGDLQMSLFTLLSYMRAQQAGQSFQLADAGIAVVLQNNIELPAPVPLPGAAWLFLMGLLGLAGGRLVRPGQAGAGRKPALAAAGASDRAPGSALAA